MKNVARIAVAITAAAVLAQLPADALAQAYPTKAVKLIVGFSPGGSADILARIVAQKLNQALKQPVVVEKGPVPAGRSLRQRWRRPRRRLHVAVRDERACGKRGALSEAVLRHPGELHAGRRSRLDAGSRRRERASAYRTLDDLVAAARKTPGKLNYAAGGGGATMTSLAAEVFKSRAKLEWCRSTTRARPSPDRADRRRGRFCLRHPVRARCRTSSRASCARWRSLRRPARRCCPTSPPWRRRAARFRGDRLVRHARAGRHSGADRRAAEPGAQRGTADAGRQGASHGAGKSSRSAAARAEFGKLIESETDALGRSDPAPGHQGRDHVQTATMKAREPRSANSRTDVVVVGGGLGGVSATLAAAALGVRVVLVEELDWLGGQLTAQACRPTSIPGSRHSCVAELRRVPRADPGVVSPALAADRGRAARRRFAQPRQGNVGTLCHEPWVAVRVHRRNARAARQRRPLAVLMRHRCPRPSATAIASRR